MHFQTAHFYIRPIFPKKNAKGIDVDDKLDYTTMIINLAQSQSIKMSESRREQSNKNIT